MRDVLPVLRVLGMLLLLFALSMLVPWATSYYQRDGVTLVWPMAMGLTALLGVALWWGLFPFKQDLQPRHGVILVTVAWVSLPLCGALPIWGVMFVQGAPISVTHAYFEAVSGLTTTGATVLSGLDALPVSLNMWRTFLRVDWNGWCDDAAEHSRYGRPAQAAQPGHHPQGSRRSARRRSAHDHHEHQRGYDPVGEAWPSGRDPAREVPRPVRRRHPGPRVLNAPRVRVCRFGTAVPWARSGCRGRLRVQERRNSR